MLAPAPSPRLFPPFVAQYSVRFDPEERSELARQFSGIALPDSLGNAVRKRQVEFLAGRWCAREALRACVPAWGDTQIAIGRCREPVWPAAVVGAITHAHGFASAAVARTSDARGLGLDVEHVMADHLVPKLLEQIAAPDELAQLVRVTGWSAAAVLTLVFSAKETVFKCLYPQVQSYFDYRDAAIIALDAASGRFSARLLRSLTPSLARGCLLEGRFERDALQVCTAMVLAP